METVYIDKFISDWDADFKNYRKEFYNLETFSCYSNIQHDKIIGKSSNLAKEIKNNITIIENEIITVSTNLNIIKEKRKSYWTFVQEMPDVGNLIRQNESIISDGLRNIKRLNQETKSKIQILENKKQQAENLYLDICGMIATIPPYLNEDFTVKSSLIYVNIDEDPIDAEEKLHKEIKIPLELFKQKILQHTQFIEIVKNANDDLENLSKSLKYMNDFIAHCSARISEVKFYKIDDEELSKLTTWFEKIKKTLADGNITAAQVGFTNWKTLFNKIKESCDSNISLAKNMIMKRDELRGRFSALLSKRIALKLSSKEVSEIEAQIKFVLVDTPITPIIKAQTLISSYTQILAKGA